LNVNEGKFREAVENSQRAIRLDSSGVPVVYYFNALANFNLQNWDAAGRESSSARETPTSH